ncbi:heme peroxidase [Lentinus tigrinus ALCF2SS1-7]|uniref:Peroxidase n=1 Tax=Lentinus tigrinus ALCF2SS1-6 TaxID=1328759 RepID=A0A5C2RUM6_9APHY|nr:heme peroxidase [Lentinus tigrinus ALCF2SS1-6]RPD73903.1 heme peroxidase [Lentinus tigrinus ALCF2SS1-7]
MASLRYLSALLLLITSATGYTWPNPQLDELERLLYDQFGFNAPGILTSVLPCNSFVEFNGIANRSNAADWIRTAYHNMATHNVEDGTGGLDASIQFELDRPENVGDGFDNTIGFLTHGINRYVSVADIFALGAATAIEQCGGPKVPFRGGRVDATAAGVPGVPEPQDSLESHIASFAKQGFNQTDMITLVACGHTFGGVQHSAFPDTVPVPAGLDDIDATFDNTPFTFDNAIASEYIHGTTNNPLVVGHNDTTNSDKRIFGSDNNATMSLFANDADLFKSACGTLLARMLDTVPSDVKLSDVIEPLPVKPASMLLKYTGDNTFNLTGLVRFYNMPESNSRTVKFVWEDRTGKKDPSYAVELGHTPLMASHGLNDGPFTALWYSVGPITKNFTLLDESTGISKFWFEIDEGDGSAGKVEDQGGLGFPLADTIMVAATTCTDTAASAVRFDVAVLASANPSRVYIRSESLGSITTAGGTGTTITVIETDVKPSENSSTSGLYDIWSIMLPFSAFTHVTTSDANVEIVADVGGEELFTASFFPTEEFPNCT